MAGVSPGLPVSLGHYRIVERIGAGGMGEVYRARDEHLARDVAIKVLPPGTLITTSARKHFRKEALILSQLSHPNVATIFDFDTQQGLDFLVMEFIPGTMLSDKVAAGALPEKEVLRMGLQLAEGLAAAHDVGVIHRDLKPGNLRVTDDGRLKILDFGLAKLRLPVSASAETESLSESQMLAGTLPYLSPEQLLGEEVDARTDIHAAGTVLYEIATGRPPFAEVERSQLIGAILRKRPQPPSSLNPRLSSGLQGIIEKCLEKEPENRYQSAKELAVDLRRLQRGILNGRIPRKRHARWPSAKVVALGIVLLVTGVFIALHVGGIWDQINAPIPSGQSIRSLAVLPVKDLSVDPSQKPFSDGLTCELIAFLSRLKAVTVISCTTAMHYKTTNKTLPQIAKELNVDGIIEASVTRSASRVRLTAQLIDARSDRPVWTNSFEHDTIDLLMLQEEFVREVAREIKLQLTLQESERLKVARRIDPEVYDSTVRAKAMVEYATQEGQLRQAIELFQKATKRDPTYAPAWAGLGEATWDLAGSGFEFVASAEVRDKAIAAAERALELDESLPEAHMARAAIAIDGEWNLEKAQQHFERALELRPGYAAAHNRYGQILVLLHRMEEARRHFDRARELDPLSPWNDVNLLGWWFGEPRPDKILEEGEQARLRNPTLWIIRWEMGDAHIMLGQPNEAVKEYQAALKLLDPERPAAVLGPLGRAYGMAGRRDDALKLLTELEQASQKRYISPLYLAMVNSGLGRMDKAFELLDRALEERTPFLLTFTPKDPSSVTFRGDPRWKPFLDRLRQRVQLPPGTPDPYS